MATTESLPSMTVIPPVAAVQAGRATGGGLLDKFTGGASGTAQTSPGDDGSVGLWDGVGKKALFGGAAGAAIGFLPFLPGGPILGGILGALGGAAMGVFSNWKKMQSIKQENQAMLAAMGVQTNDPQVQQILQSGNVQQLIPYMQQGGATQAAPQQVTVQQQNEAVAQGQLPAVVDPGAAPQQSPVPTQGAPGQVAVGSGAVTGAINPAQAVSPGVAPAVTAAGGPAPGTSSADVTAIAPLQAGAGISTDSSLAATAVTNAQLAEMVRQLERQVALLKAYLAEQERIEELDKAQAR